MNARRLKKIEQANAQEGSEDGHIDVNAGRSPSANEDELATAMLSLDTLFEARLFLRDLCTPEEIRTLTERLRVARMLDEGSLSYREISERTGVSTTTVARVARFLFHENNLGYRVVLGRLREKDNGSEPT